ncbi:MAG: histidine phosphatase family protein [Alphaproteobacteria bacterium]|nr:histidine phosphatase family protein [Alphaproteobacteria bacterium]
MIAVALIRHAPTAWNAEHRLQGRTDVPLSAEGRSLASSWRLPEPLTGYEAWASPLGRARETASLLGLDPRIDERLIESSWGEWESQMVSELRKRPGFAEVERRGLDLAAPGGESVRQVQARLLAWLGTLTQPALAISHNGVLRAAYSLATGWTMIDDPPERMKAASAHLYAWDGTRLTLDRLNLPLAP